MSTNTPAPPPAELEAPVPSPAPHNPSPAPVESPAPPKPDVAKPDNPKPDAPSTPAAKPPPAEKQLSAKELKEKKKAEKAARRQQNKATAPPPVQKQSKGEKPSLPPKSPGHPKGSHKKGQDGIVKTIYVSNNNDRAPRPPISSAVKEPELPAEPVKDKSLVGLLKDLEIEQQSHRKKKDADSDGVYGIE